MTEEIDNSQLNLLMKNFLENKSTENQQLFIDELKNSRLIMSIELRSEIPIDIENINVGDTFKLEEGLRFKPLILTDDNGKNCIFLFTDREMSNKSGINSDVMVFFTENLVDILKNHEDEIDYVVINYGDSYGINIDLQTFINMFNESDNTLEVILNLLRTSSEEFGEDVVVFYNSKENVMINNAINGIYVNPTPMPISYFDDIEEGKPYINEIYVDKKDKRLCLSESSDPRTDPMMILAPQSHFELIEEVDEYTSRWKCIEQQFYDEK